MVHPTSKIPKRDDSTLLFFLFNPPETHGLVRDLQVIYYLTVFTHIWDHL
jgi:hypothetical protein